MIELRHLRYFVAVAEELHFTRAARSLNIAQPPLSQQIRRLETLLGTPLFLRTSRKVVLTPAGEKLLEGARTALAEVSRAIEGAQRAVQGDTQTIRIGFTDSAALSVLPSALRRFTAKYPNVHLDLREGTTSSQIEALERQVIDIALVRGPIRATPPLRVETILREAFVVAVPDDHFLSVRDKISLRELAGEPIVLFPRRLAPEFHDTITRMCHDAGFVPNVVFEAAEYQTILSLIAGGQGVSIVPASVQNLARAGVVFRKTPGKMRAEIAAVYRPESQSAACSEFVDTFRKLHPAAACGG